MKTGVTANSGLEESPLSGDAFRGVCDHIFWSNASPRENAAFRNGDVVFCKIDEVWRLFRALRRTRKRIVLVTGEGSKPVTSRIWRRRPPQVTAWFGTNMFVADTSAHQLPLGLGNAGADTTPSYAEIHNSVAAGHLREKLLYANFSPRTNPAVREPLWHRFEEPGYAWATRANHTGATGKNAYLSEIVRHRFVLCPPGTGEDTHRFWESLYAGCIPVIRSSAAMEAFARLFPVLVLPDLRELSRPLLDNFTSAHEADCRKLPALWVPFWKERIYRAKSEIAVTQPLPWFAFCSAWLREAAAVLRERIAKETTVGLSCA